MFYECGIVEVREIVEDEHDDDEMISFENASN